MRWFSTDKTLPAWIQLTMKETKLSSQSGGSVGKVKRTRWFSTSPSGNWAYRAYNRYPAPTSLLNTSCYLAAHNDPTNKTIDSITRHFCWSKIESSACKPKLEQPIKQNHNYSKYYSWWLNLIFSNGYFFADLFLIFILIYLLDIIRNVCRNGCPLRWLILWNVIHDCHTDLN